MFYKTFYCTHSNLERAKIPEKETLLQESEARGIAVDARLQFAHLQDSHSHSLTLSHSHTLSLSHSHTLTLSHSHTPEARRIPVDARVHFAQLEELPEPQKSRQGAGRRWKALEGSLLQALDFISI